MPLLDKRRRVPGGANLFDAFIVGIVVVVAVLAYQRLSAPHRVAPPYALDSHRVVQRVDLQLPADQVWICGVIAPGQVERDPRTGDVQVEVLGCVVEAGLPILSLRVTAVRDGQDRVLFENAPLVPGRELEVDTEAALLKGVVRTVEPESP